MANELDNSKANEEVLQKKLSVKCRENKSQLQSELKSMKFQSKYVKQYQDMLTNRLKGRSNYNRRSTNQYIRKSLLNAKNKLNEKQQQVDDLQAQVNLLKDEYAQLNEDSFRDQEKARDAMEENN